jgi:YggT family protein
MLRFILQQVRADFYNPISQFIVKATAPVLNPARKLIPGFGGIDLATIIVVVAFIAIKIFLVALLSGYTPSVLALLLTGIRDFITLAINIFIFAIIVQAILSWINPDPYNPVSGILFSITRPVLTPFRRLIKPVGGLDLSPLVALIALMFLERLVAYLFQLL